MSLPSHRFSSWTNERTALATIRSSKAFCRSWWGSFITRKRGGGWIKKKGAAHRSPRPILLHLWYHSSLSLYIRSSIHKTYHFPSCIYIVVWCNEIDPFCMAHKTASVSSHHMWYSYLWWCREGCLCFFWTLYYACKNMTLEMGKQEAKWENEAW